MASPNSPRYRLTPSLDFFPPGSVASTLASHAQKYSEWHGSDRWAARLAELTPPSAEWHSARSSTPARVMRHEAGRSSGMPEPTASVSTMHSMRHMPRTRSSSIHEPTSRRRRRPPLRLTR